ncbi:MAG TPA: Do family serine endopeptidase [bacterium]|nr:Do family serine endopeptidase [bacterium]
MWSKQIKIWSGAGLILAGVVAGIVFSANMNWMTPGVASEAESKAAERAEPPPDLPSIQNMNRIFVDAAQEILPTVVSISTSRMVERSRSSSLPPLLRDWFGLEDSDPPARQRQYGLGSGVVVSRDGYILTNHHVINESDDIQVTLYDKRVVKGDLVGTDPLTEIAVIKVDAGDLTAARLGDSEILEIGEWVMAVGNPLELSSTVTAGIVSAKGRNIQLVGRGEEESNFAIENFIQTDAAINRGNSGGPLVNLRGEVVGINTAIASGTGYYAGYGFAVPINLARKVMQDLIEKGFVVRAYMGLAMRNVDKVIADRFGMDRPTGVLVAEVVEDSPAEKAGMKPLDVILKLDGKEVTQSNQVQNMVALKNPGDTVALTILRDGKERAVRIKLGQRETGRSTVLPQEEETSFADLGLTVRDLTDELRSRFEWYRDDEGVLVTDLERYSAAAEANITRGSLILQIEDQPVTSVSDYRRILKKAEKGQVVIFHCKYRDTRYHAFVKIPN